jgi:hypothetical protein
MRARYLAVALVVSLMCTSAMASGGGGRGGGRASGHSNSGRSAGARHGSSASRSRSGHDRHYRSAVPRSSSYRGVTTRYGAAGGRSYLGYRNHRHSSYRYRPYNSYRSYYRPSLFAGLYLGSPWYYDSYYYGGYYPETYAYAPPAADDRYREPAAEPEGMADVENDGARSDDQDRDGDSVADAQDSGRLRLDVRPADATIYVDDQFHGTAGSTTVLTLAPGRHTVEVARPGFQTERRVVEVGRGEGRSLSIALQRAYR